MHHLYHTDGFILGSFALGEANKIFLIYTKEFGLLRAQAQGVRLEKSKLKSHLQDFSFINVSLVRAREFWRITNASLDWNVFGEIFYSDDKKKVLSRIISLCRRLINGEEKNEAVFQTLSSGISLLKDKDFPVDKLADFEAVMVLRILAHLGYMGESEFLSRFTEAPAVSFKLVETIRPHLRSALVSINESLRATNL